MLTNTESWAKEEVVNSKFGDKRLNRRFGELLGTFVSRPSASVLKSCKDWGGAIAAYRFFSNKKVTKELILGPHIESTLNRIKEQNVVLLVQDTTEIDYNHRAPIDGLGPLQSDRDQGFYLHPLLAVTPERLCLGLLDANIWVRDELGKKKLRKQKPIEEKESFRWLQAHRLSNEIAKQSPDTQIINLSDREGDIYEIFAEYKSNGIQENAHFITRAYHNRRVLNNNDNDVSKLWDYQKKAKKYGSIQFNLSKTEKRESRVVTQDISAGKINVIPPERKGYKLPKTHVNAVFCKEKNAPDGADPVDWVLLTSLPVDTEEQVLNVIKYYLCRWQIEIFFKILKSGCKVEQLQLKKFENIERALAFYLIVAWRVLFLTMVGRECPELPCNIVLEDEEWRSVYMVIKKQKPPTKPPTIRDMMRMIASLGGFLGRKSDGEPGPKPIWIGLQRMRDFTLAWQSYEKISSSRQETCV